MSTYATLGLQDFLITFPGMSVCPVRESELQIEGIFSFTAEFDDYGRITDAFNIRIKVPSVYPMELPIVNELGGRIPAEIEFHVNPHDRSLCLGSPLRLLRTIVVEPTLNGFAKRCLIPYLYAVSRKLLYGGPFLFGELDHGRPGHLADYVELFGVTDEHQVIRAVQYLGMKKRIANKRFCPCDCGRRLGICGFNRRLRKFRSLAQRGWYRKLFSNL